MIANSVGDQVVDVEQTSVDGGAGTAWLISEDNNPLIGPYGDPVAATPAIDRLAAEGIRYETAYSAAPVCAPYLRFVLTGTYTPSSPVFGAT